MAVRRPSINIQGHLHLLCYHTFSYIWLYLPGITVMNWTLIQSNTEKIHARFSIIALVRIIHLRLHEDQYGRIQARDERNAGSALNFEFVYNSFGPLGLRTLEFRRTPI